MKTILEWLKTIPNEDTRAKAIANYNKIGEVDIVTSLSSAIFCAFSWRDSPEKGDFWYGVYDEFLAMESETN